MIAVTILVMALLQVPQVLDRLDGPEVTRDGFVVELIQRPAGIEATDFAQQLVDAEGLRPWNGQYQGPSAYGLHAISVLAGDGRNVVVYYLPTESHEARGRACRIRATRPGASNTRWGAFRWCHSAFGLQTPQTPPPPIASITTVR